VGFHESLAVFGDFRSTPLLNFNEFRFSIFRTTHQHHADESDDQLEEPSLLDERNEFD
jgi:hypothetical protein